MAPRPGHGRTGRRFHLALAAIVVVVSSVWAVPASSAERNWLQQARWLRSFWSSPPAELTEDPALSAKIRKHNEYQTRTGTCGHSQDPSSPHYTADGDYAARNSILQCWDINGAAAISDWAGTPLHGEQLLNPRLTVTGFDDSMESAGFDTLTHRRGGPAITAPMTWPNGTGFPFLRWSGGETPDPRTACPTMTGPPLFLFAPSGAQVNSIIMRTHAGTSVPICTMRPRSVEGAFPYMSAAIGLPAIELALNTRYIAEVNVDGATVTWDFTTGTGGPDRTLEVVRAGTGGGRVTSHPAGIDCPGACTAPFPDASTVTLRAIPDAESDFTGWSGGCSGTATCTVSMTANATVTATFRAKPAHALTVTKTGPGSGTVSSAPAGIECGSTCQASFVEGTAVTLQAAAAPGSYLAAWSGDCTGAGACAVGMAGTRSVGALFELDAEPPAAAELSGSGVARSFTRSRRLALRWSATDTASGVQSADIRYRRATYRTGTFAPPGEWRTGLEERKTSLRGKPGSTYCFSARARDRAGNVSGFGPERCGTVPLDDRSLEVRGAWILGQSNDYFMGGATRTHTRGATLTIDDVWADELALVVTTCSTCGRVEVSVDGTPVEQVSLRSSSVTHRVVRMIDAAPLRGARVRVRVISSDRLVVIDGLGLRLLPG